MATRRIDPVILLRRKAIEDAATACGMTVNDVWRAIGGEYNWFERVWTGELSTDEGIFDCVMRLHLILGLLEFDPVFLLHCSIDDPRAWAAEHADEIVTRRHSLADNQHGETKRRLRESTEYLVKECSRTVVVVTALTLAAILLCVIGFLTNGQWRQSAWIFALVLGVGAAASFALLRRYRTKLGSYEAMLLVY